MTKKKAQFLKNPSQPNSDSMMLDGVVALWKSENIDPSALITGDKITVWEDVINGYDFVQTVVASQPTLVFGTSGKKQLNFNGSQWMTTPHNAAFDFGNTEDEYTCIVGVGDRVDNNYFIFAKAPPTLGQRSFGMTTDQIQGGGTYSWLQNRTIPLNSITIWRNGLTSTLVERDGVVYHSGNTLGTAVRNTNALNLACRSDGAGARLNGTIEYMAIYNRYLTDAETLAIVTEYQTNP